jgi:hypothetical protein
MAKNIMDALASRARVRVYKPAPNSDDRSSLCGEPLQKDFDKDGNERHFFEVPAHQGDYLNSAFRKYSVSEPFIPGVDSADDLKTLDKEFACQVEGCGKVFKRAQDLSAHMKMAHKE